MSANAGLSKVANPMGAFLVLGAAVILAAGILAFGKLAVAALVGLMAFALFVYYPVLGTYATMALLLLQGAGGTLTNITEQTNVALTLGQLCGVTAVVAWLTHLLLTKTRFGFNWPVFLICFFCLWALLCTILSSQFGDQWGHWMRLIMRLAFFILAINTLNTPRNLHYYVIVLLGVGLAMALLSVVQYFLPGLQVASVEAWAGLTAGDTAFIDQESLSGEAAIRVSGRAGHSNWLAMMILLILPLNVYLLNWTKDRRLKSLVYFALAMELLTLVLTFTRTGLLIGIVLVSLLLLKRLSKITPLRLFACLLALCVAWVVLPQAYKERVLSPKQYTQSTSVQSRLELQKTAVRYFAEHPFTGLGVGGFGLDFIHENNQTATTMKYLFKNREVFIGTHNMYLQIACEIGVIGLLLFVLFYGRMLRDISRAEQRFKSEEDEQGQLLASTLFVSLIGFMVCAIFLHALLQEIWWMIAAAAIAIPLYGMKFKGADMSLPHGLSTEAKRPS